MLLTTKKGAQEAIIKDLTAYQAALEAQSAMRKVLLTAKGRMWKLLTLSYLDARGFLYVCS